MDAEGEVDAAEVSRLEAILARVGRALDDFNTMRYPDSQSEPERWKTRLDGPLPLSGQGIDATVAIAGTTNTGAIDPLDVIGELAAQEQVWFHVDGAYGLPGIMDERKKPLYRGLELADSVIVDPHKWLGAQVGVATTFIRDREILYRAFTQEPADYLEGSADSPEVRHSLDGMGIPYYDFGVELSSPPRGVVVWAMLKETGSEGLRRRIVRHNDMAAQVAERARSEGNLELLLEPTLSICCFRFVDSAIADLNGFNRQLYRRLLIENEHLPSTTMVNGCYAIRPCFLGAKTVWHHADELVDAVLRIGREMLWAY